MMDKKDVESIFRAVKRLAEKELGRKLTREEVREYVSKKVAETKKISKKQ